jgi:NAD(P)H dehydrogenase (quinone)
MTVHIVVTGATGAFGGHAVEALLRRGISPGQVVATGRGTARLEALRQLGVTVRRADYDDPASLDAAFAGADRLLFVSGSEPGPHRIEQHQAVIDAAARAGIGLVAYTSAPKADTSDMILSADHAATERALADSGVPYVFLRNGWYIENYFGALPAVLEYGLTGAVGDGLISGAARADLAEAAAAVVVGDGHENRVYELGGQAFTLPVLAAEFSRLSGRPVGYSNLPPGDYAAFLSGAGVPSGFAEILADADRAAAKGALYVEGNELECLLGRPVTPLADVIRMALEQAGLSGAPNAAAPNGVMPGGMTPASGNGA